MDDPLLLLCGGLSHRMGAAKPLLKWGGRSLIAAHTAAAAPYCRVWLAADGAFYPDTAAAEYLPDLLPGKQGALSAIAPALRRAGMEGCGGIYVMSCDTLLEPERVMALLDTAAATTAWREGVVMLAGAERGFPLLAHWSAALAERLAEDVAAGWRRVYGWLADKPLACVPLAAHEWPLANFNTPAEFFAARACVRAARTTV